ncbi:MAG: pentapeptide repeat-containing protein [Candidatus Babeliaceae bacterium]
MINCKKILLLTSILAGIAYAGNQEHLRYFSETGECKSCDLSNFDLRDVLSKFKEQKKLIDLRGANLSNSNLSDANLSHANLSHANLSYAYLFNANLSYAYLFNANLYHANLAYAYLFNADFSGVKNLSWMNTIRVYLSFRQNKSSPF